MADPRKRRDDAELFDALEERRMRDLAEETKAMTDEEIARDIGRHGGEPGVFGKKMKALLDEKLTEGRAPMRLAAGLGRAELVAIVDENRGDPRVARALAGRAPESLTVEELYAVIAALRADPG